MHCHWNTKLFVQGHVTKLVAIFSKRHRVWNFKHSKVWMGLRYGVVMKFLTVLRTTLISSQHSVNMALLANLFVQGFSWNSATPTISCWRYCDSRLPWCVRPKAVCGFIMIKLTVFLGNRIAIFIRRESPTVSQRLTKRLRARKKGRVICSDNERS